MMNFMIIDTHNLISWFFIILMVKSVFLIKCCLKCFLKKAYLTILFCSFHPDLASFFGGKEQAVLAIGMGCITCMVRCFIFFSN